MPTFLQKMVLVITEVYFEQLIFLNVKQERED